MCQQKFCWKFDCERVFALIKTMFGEQQMLSLSDMIQAALMLRSNGRRVG